MKTFLLRGRGRGRGRGITSFSTETDGDQSLFIGGGGLGVLMVLRRDKGISQYLSRRGGSESLFFLELKGIKYILSDTTKFLRSLTPPPPTPR